MVRGPENASMAHITVNYEETQLALSVAKLSLRERKELFGVEDVDIILKLSPETIEAKVSRHKQKKFAFDFGDILTYTKPDGEDVMALFIEHPNKDRQAMKIYMINEDMVATVRSRCVKHTGYGTRFLPRKKRRACGQTTADTYI